MPNGEIEEASVSVFKFISVYIFCDDSWFTFCTIFMSFSSAQLSSCTIFVRRPNRLTNTQNRKKNQNNKKYEEKDWELTVTAFDHLFRFIFFFIFLFFFWSFSLFPSVLFPFMWTSYRPEQNSNSLILYIISFQFDSTISFDYFSLFLVILVTHHLRFLGNRFINATATRHLFIDEDEIQCIKNNKKI